MKILNVLFPKRYASSKVQTKAVENKKGDKYEIDYKDGKIIKSKKNFGLEKGAVDMADSFVKIYKYKKDGSKQITTIFKTPKGQEKYVSTIDKDLIRIHTPEGIRETGFRESGLPSWQNLPDGTISKWHSNGQKFYENHQTEQRHVGIKMVK